MEERAICVLLLMLFNGLEAAEHDYAPDLENIPALQFSGFSVNKPGLFSAKRPGNPSNDHQCNQVGSVPSQLTFITRYNYYRKYTHAYGIPIVSSAYVSDAALKRACYVVHVLLADRSSIRYYLYKNFGRAGVIGSNEGVTQIPEHSWLPAWWNQRARGLGGTLIHPISTGAEENLLCWTNDRYRAEDIFLHEFSHGIQEIALTSGALPGFISRLQNAYNYAKSSGLWANTYSMSTWKEYFAEGVQSYFHVNAYSKPPDGVHNHINTRSALQRYDPTLYGLIREVFPCGNYIKDRCDKSDNLVSLRMDCDKTGKATTNAPTMKATTTPDAGNSSTTTPDAGNSSTTTPSAGNSSTTPRPSEKATTTTTIPGCNDENTSCKYWASIGECNRNPAYMKVKCKKSCGLCSGNGGASCTDSNQYCPSWAARGECSRNPGYMLVSCKKSCSVC